MYERSAIVLERYFENLLEYRRKCNLRDNFTNYCELVEKLEKFQTNYQKEVTAIQEYNVALKKIKTIQLSQEKLYKRSAKLEYNRNLLFNNVDGKIEEIQRCIEKIEVDVDKNNQEMKNTKTAFLEALAEFNEKKFELSKCKRYKKMAENDYNEIFEKAKTNFDGIEPETIATVKEFAKFEDNDDIIATLEENGKDEKIPFNEGVIENATAFGVEMAKKEAASYLVIYDKMNKLLTDINNGSARIELHKKYLRNEKAKIDFIFGAKEYIIQFLDYERMTIIHGRKSHNRLMNEACENFNTDVVQINNLFELLLREITNKATKKAYKELYNKSYLTDIKDKEEKFKKEKNRVNLNTATLINSNYWRIEGIRNIYTIFYKNVSEVFGRDVAEFDIPKEFDETTSDEQETPVEVEKSENGDIIDEEPIEKMPFEIDDSYEESENEENIEINDEDEDLGEKNNNISIDDFDDEEDEEDNDDEIESYDDIVDSVVEKIENNSEDEEFDIFGEKYRDMDFLDSDVLPAKIKRQKVFEEEEIPYEVEEEEEGLFDTIKKAKNKKNNEIEDFDLMPEDNKGNVLKKLRKINNVKKKKASSDIW